MAWPYILAAAGGVASAYGARRQQQQSQAMAREQMAFQERMSSTAFQRAAKDLEAAGLNRILALGSPASSPGGAMGQAQNILGQGVSAGVSSAQAMATVRNTKLQGDIIAPEAHRARLILKAQKAVEKKARATVKGARSSVKTYPYPNTQPGKGEKFAYTRVGQGVTEFMNRLDRITNPRGYDDSSVMDIPTPSNAKDVKTATVIQHMDIWAEEYYEKHGKWPSEAEMRAEFERVKGSY